MLLHQFRSNPEGSGLEKPTGGFDDFGHPEGPPAQRVMSIRVRYKAIDERWGTSRLHCDT